MTVEDIYFYLDLANKNFKKKDLVKTIEKYLKFRGKVAQQGCHYGLFFFKEGGIPLLVSEEKDPEKIVDAIKEDWNARAHESFLENGLFFCLSDIANHFQTNQGHSLRIIVISDTPSGQSSIDKEAQEEKTRALLDLVEKFKYFPTFIDIVRLGDEKFYPDDVKLRLITMTTNGGLFYAKNTKMLEKVLNGLVVNKDTAPLDPTGAGTYISPDHKLFYEQLAGELIPSTSTAMCCVCQQDKSPYAEGLEDRAGDAAVCFNCSLLYHDLCAAKYAYEHNIGLYHIFRCKNCGTLLKAKEALVQRVNNLAETEDLEKRLPGGEQPEDFYPEEEEEIVTGNIEAANPEKEKAPIIKTATLQAPKPAGAKAAMGMSPARAFFAMGTPKRTTPEEALIDETTGEENPDKVMFEPEKVEVRKVWSPNEQKGQGEDRVSGASRGRPNPAIRLCPFCGNSLPPDVEQCPNCGSRL